jgi:hypothetical protein
MKQPLLAHIATGLGVCCFIFALAGSASAQLLFLDNFDKSGPPCCDDIDPGTGDALGRQTGLYAPLDYIEDLDHEHPSGVRNNMTQVNNPAFPNALQLAPSTDTNFEMSVPARADHDFADAPGAGNQTVIEVDMNPVHDSSGVQVTSTAAAKLDFTLGSISLFDHGGWSFQSGTDLASGDLDPADSGGSGGPFAGFHQVRVELETAAYVLSNLLNLRVLVDGVPLPIDTDGTPSVLETSLGATGGLFVRLIGETDSTAPGKISGFTAFTLHGFDNLRIAIEPVPEPSSLLMLILAAGISCRLRRRAAD